MRKNNKYVNKFSSHQQLTHQTITFFSLRCSSLGSSEKKAHSAVFDNEIIEEQEFNAMPENISSAVTKDDVLKELANLEKYFRGEQS